MVRSKSLAASDKNLIIITKILVRRKEEIHPLQTSSKPIMR